MYHDSNMLENANSTPSDPAIKLIVTSPKKLLINRKLFKDRTLG